jgi:hypothetical protein
MIALALIATHWAYSQAKPEGPVLFRDVTARSGISFRHVNSATAEKFLVETMGSGGAFLDYDADGYLDVFLLNGGPVAGNEGPRSFYPALYRNQRDGTFKDVTGQAGIQRSELYSQGIAVGDYDKDGYDDVFITNFSGRNILYRNNGDGTFTDVTQKAGVGGDGHWSVSAAFLDFDNDGNLDLFVTRYLNHNFDNNRVCGPWLELGIRSYCSPKVYEGLSNTLYRNRGDGTFTDVSEKAGIAKYKGKSLGVVAGDFDLDGWIDLYVANDSEGNFLFHNRKDGTFQEVGLAQGVAFDENGASQAGMGTAMGDFDGDGLPDLVVTNLNFEYMALYRNMGKFFVDVSSTYDVQRTSRPFVGFGVGFLDFDNDGDLDIFVANGHIIDNTAKIQEGTSYAQPKLLFENRKGRFDQVAGKHGEALVTPQVSRGLAMGDYDNDGDVDLLVTNNGARPMLLENDGGNRQNWLEVRLKGIKSNSNAIGARLELAAGPIKTKTQIWGGGSYLSASSYDVHFGLGNAARVDQLTIKWPSGTIDILRDITARQLIHVQEGKGTWRPIVKPSRQMTGGR